MKKLLNNALEAAQKLSSSFGGMASVHLMSNPYTHEWIAEVTWSLPNTKLSATRGEPEAALRALIEVIHSNCILRPQY